MTINKRIKFNSSSIKRLGLIPDGEEYCSAKHRIASFTIFSDKPLTAKDKYETVIYRGHNQVKDETTIVVKCNTILQLKSISGLTKLIMVTRTGYEGGRFDHVLDKNCQERFYIPLCDPIVDGWHG